MSLPLSVDIVSTAVLSMTDRGQRHGHGREPDV